MVRNGACERAVLTTGEMESTVLASTLEEEPWPLKEDQRGRKSSPSTLFQEVLWRKASMDWRIPLNPNHREDGADSQAQASRMDDEPERT